MLAVLVGYVEMFAHAEMIIRGQLPDASTVVIHEEFDCWDAGKDPPGTLVEVVSGEAGTGVCVCVCVCVCGARRR